MSNWSKLSQEGGLNSALNSSSLF